MSRENDIMCVRGGLLLLSTNGNESDSEPDDDRGDKPDDEEPDKFDDIDESI